VKVGQLLSTRPDLVPEYMITEFEHLHQKVSVAPFSDFEVVLEEELGRDWRRLFRSIEVDEPLGAASLAQVYRADLHSGQAAVVKIQRPGIVPVMLDDMALLRQGARFLARRAPDINEVIDLEAMLEVVFRAMEPELDFKIEARNMAEASTIAEHYDTIAIPEVFHVTSRLLVQGLAPGVSIRDADRSAFSDEERTAIGRDLLGFMLRGYFVDRMFHADPHPGNVFVAPGHPAHIIDWGMIGRFDKRMSFTVLATLLNLARNDGVGLAKNWIEMGRATSWANIPGFQSDMANLIPTLAGASMDDLNLGVSLSAILKFATRRGIQTPPVLGLLGKSFANIDGSVRSLTPEVGVIEVFREELQDLLFDLARDVLSEEQAMMASLQIVTGALAAPEDTRTLMRDAANRELTLNINQSRSRRSEERSDAASAHCSAPSSPWPSPPGGENANAGSWYKSPAALTRRYGFRGDQQEHSERQVVLRISALGAYRAQAAGTDSERTSSAVARVARRPGRAWLAVHAVTSRRRASSLMIPGVS
jgi:ubiquinone biosynthesis protein